MRVLGLILALGLLYCVANAQTTTCGVLNCVLGQECCNNVTCFNPDLFQCCNSKALCAHGDSCCGTNCYDPATSFCCKNAVVCNLNDEVCCPPDGNGLTAVNDCGFLDENAFRLALYQAVCGQAAPCNAINPSGNGGFNTNVWATVVNRVGTVCSVAFSGFNYTDQMPSGRVDSAARAWTANSNSVVNLALSSANLYAQALPGGIWYGVQFSNPIDAALVNSGDQLAWGGPCSGQLPSNNNTGGNNGTGGAGGNNSTGGAGGNNSTGGAGGNNSTGNTTTARFARADPAQQMFTGADPMCGKFVGGIQTLGGGLALYSSSGFLVGGIGIGGDTACTDHIIAWKLRHSLLLDFIPAGVGAGNTDNIIFPATEPFGHPVCNSESTTIAQQLPTQFPVSRRTA